MSKNLTRKGLALGAVVALGATVFAGTPAFAAGEVVFTATGTSYNTFVTDTLTLNASLAAGQVAGNIAQLKYSVVTDGSYVIKAVATSGSATTAYANGATGGYAANLTGVGALHYAPTTSFVVAPGAPTATTVNTIALSVDSVADATVATTGVVATATTATKSAVVTAFIDSNNNNVADAGEFAQARTVNFVKYSEVVPVVTLTAPKLGDTSLKATATVGDLNIATAADLTVAFTGATGVDAAPGVVAASGVFTDGTISNITTSTPITAQAYYKTVALGSAVSATATARTITSVTANVVKGNDAVATAATTAAASTNAVVRTNGTFVASVKALDTATTPVAAPSIAVAATFATSATLVPASTGVTEKSVTVNGTKYTTNAALTAASVALTTDASGVATVTVSSSGLVATNTITVSFSAQNFTSAVVAAQTDAAYTVSDDNGSTVIATNKNTPTTLTYSVKDQFGVLSARTNERLVVTATTAATVTQYVPVVAGKVSFVVTPVTDSTASIAVSSVLQGSTTDVVTGTTWATAGTNTVTNTVNIRSAAYSFTVAPAIDATNGINNGAWTVAGAQKQTLTTAALADLAAVAAGTTWAKVTLTGSNAGEKLTVSGTGVYLSIDAAAATADSASKVAQGASAVIYVASNTSGAKTLTVSNGTVSATVVVTFAGAAVTSGAAIAFGEATTSSQAGRSVDVTAIITDKFGNVVAGTTGTEAASISATGVGYLANTTTATDASGKIVAKLIVGAGETGDAVVTASFKMADGTVKTVVKTISFGVTDAQIDNVGKRVTAVASFSKGKTVSFYVDGIKKWSKLSASDADVVVNYNLKKGRHTVTMKISGGLVATEVIVVK